MGLGRGAFSRARGHQLEVLADVAPAAGQGQHEFVPGQVDLAGLDPGLLDPGLSSGAGQASQQGGVGGKPNTDLVGFGPGSEALKLGHEAVLRGGWTGNSNLLGKR